MKYKLVLITGATRGIGAATAESFAHAGHDLIITGRSKEALAAEASKCRLLGANSVTELQVDFSDPNFLAEVRSWLHRVGSRRDLRPIDVLINNAAVLERGRMEGDISDMLEQITVNLSAPMALTAELLAEPGISETIINIGSDAAIYGRLDIGVYCATKGGIRSFTRALKQEQPRLNVFCINPGMTQTDMSNFHPHGMHAGTVARAIFTVVIEPAIVPENVTDVNVGPVYNDEAMPRCFNFDITEAEAEGAA